MSDIRYARIKRNAKTRVYSIAPLGLMFKKGEFRQIPAKLEDFLREATASGQPTGEKIFEVFTKEEAERTLKKEAQERRRRKVLESKLLPDEEETSVVIGGKTDPWEELRKEVASMSSTGDLVLPGGEVASEVISSDDEGISDDASYDFEKDLEDAFSE